MNVGRGGSMDWRVALASTAVTALALGTALLGGCRPSVEALDPTTMPESVRPDYRVFERRCSKCHSLARPLTSGITDQGRWEGYVVRMRRRCASSSLPCPSNSFNRSPSSVSIVPIARCTVSVPAT